MTTDVRLSKIPYIVNLAPLLSTDRMVVSGFDRVFRDGRTVNGLIDVDAIQAAVQSASSGEGMASRELVSADEACT